MLKYLTAGESHGSELTAIIEGLPANLKINFDAVDRELHKRQQGYGRGARQKIESDKAVFTAGIRNGMTTGAPIAMKIVNKDYENWAAFMDAKECDTETKKLTAVRPGHADLAGCIKYNQTDARNILERASARQTAIRTAVGAVCAQFLGALGITGEGRVLTICGTEKPEKQHALIDKARAEGDTLGGVVEVTLRGVKAGLGSHTEWYKKADGRFAAALMSIQSVKAAEVGAGASAAYINGEKIHDRIYPSAENGKFYTRKTNFAGGIEGGITNGEDIILTVSAKPLPSLASGLDTIDINTKKAVKGASERSDVCAVEALAVIAANVAAITMAELVLEKTGGDHMEEILERWNKL